METKKVKLSPAMKEVVNRMRGGHTIYVRPSGYIRVSQNILSSWRVVIGKSTLNALIFRGIIKEGKKVDLDVLYNLTELGKSITI